jgi:hypothetical protein
MAKQEHDPYPQKKAKTEFRDLGSGPVLLLLLLVEMVSYLFVTLKAGRARHG